MSAALIATVPVSLAGDVPSRPGVDTEAAARLPFGMVVALGFLAAGVALVQMRPRNLVGWLLLVTGLLHALAGSASAYGARALTDPDGSLPGGLLATWVDSWVGVPALLLPTLVMPAIYPTGRPPSRFWAWYIRLCLVATGLLMLSAMVDGATNDIVAGTHMPWRTPEWWAWATAGTSALLLVPAVVVVIVGTLVRMVRARTPERQQLLWLISVIGIAVATIFLPASEVPFMLVYACIPLAVMVGVLRYRLLGIEVALRRTVVFGALATFITAVYVVVVVGLGRLIGSGDRPNLALSVAATAIVAVAFEPVRDRLQGFANRLVYGERATPYEVLSSLADRMGGAYDATELLPLMARTVGRGIDATRSQVWLRHDNRFDLAVTWNADEAAEVPAVMSRDSLESIEGDRVTEVRDQGELLGAIAVVKAPGTELTPVEDRLLETLSAQAGPVLRNVRLIEDLRVSRQRLVSTQDDERRRLERNLHDGAQQSLVALALMLGLVQSKVAAQEQRAGASLEQAADELGRAIEDLRALARGIYPVVLTERGLGAALSSLAERLPVPTVVENRLADRAAPDIERALYFVAFETLTSAGRAGAREAVVQLERSGSVLALHVDDDGSPPDDPDRSLALQNLLDRAAVVDADIVVAEAPAGLHLVCNIGLPDLPQTDETENTDVTAIPLGAGQ